MRFFAPDLCNPFAQYDLLATFAGLTPVAFPGLKALSETISFVSTLQTDASTLQQENR